MQLDDMNTGLQAALQEAAIHELKILLSEIQKELWMIRKKVDPGWEHPYDQIAEAVIKRMEEIQAEHGKQGPSA